MKDFKDYIGKTLECLASGDEVFLTDGTTFSYRFLNRTDVVMAYDDEGEFLALLRDGKKYAKIII